MKLSSFNSIEKVFNKLSQKSFRLGQNKSWNLEMLETDIPHDLVEFLSTCKNFGILPSNFLKYKTVKLQNHNLTNLQAAQKVWADVTED